MPYVALKRQTIKRDGSYVQVYPGDPVPEAEFWPNKKSWIRQKFIKFVEQVEVIKVPVQVVIEEEVQPKIEKENFVAVPKPRSKAKKKKKKKK